MWTEETVETLKKYALEGRSAAWIAAAIGAPSRSAVIGKANRIGVKLNGLRAGPIGRGSCLQPPQSPIAWGHTRSPIAREPRSERQPLAGRGISRARSGVAISRQKRRAEHRMFATAEVGEMRRIGLADIREAECRWPLGDPLEEDFAFCGLEVVKGHAYCAGHCRLVYRSPRA
jgi:GcrA cell cycle regulator